MKSDQELAEGLHAHFDDKLKGFYKEAYPGSSEERAQKYADAAVQGLVKLARSTKGG